LKFQLGYWELPEEYVKLIRKVVNDYNKASSDPKLTSTSLDGLHYYRDLSKRFRAGGAPDMFYCYSDLNSKLLWKGWTGLLEDFIPESANYKDEISSEQYLKSIFSKDGRLFSIPYYSSHTAFLYNEKHLQRVGFSEPPKDWNQLEELATRLRDRGICKTPVLVPLHGDGSVETLYSVILGFNPPSKSYLFDESDAPVFDQVNSPLYNVMKWLVDGIYRKRMVSRQTVAYDVIPAGEAMKRGEFTFVWVPWYNLPHINHPNGRKWSSIKQAVNPGYGYTTCYIRTYTASIDALKGGSQRLAGLWRVLQYLGGKTNERLEPDFKRGTFRTAKRLALEIGVPSPYDALWEDEEYCSALDRWGDVQTYKEQDKRVYNSLNDPNSPPWLAEWNGEWAPAPLRNTVHSILWRDMSGPEILGALKKLAGKWNELKRNYDRRPKRES
jgi:multiple sugar transport system substrate-binding protein